MHLEKAHFNTNGKCRKKLNAKQQRIKEEHDAWLRKRGLHIDQLKVKKSKEPKISDTVTIYDRRLDILPSNKVGNGFKKEEKVYTGSYITGVAVMHKSNLVPITNRKQAEEISKMRRG